MVKRVLGIIVLVLAIAAALYWLWHARMPDTPQKYKKSSHARLVQRDSRYSVAETWQLAKRRISASSTSEDQVTWLQEPGVGPQEISGVVLWEERPAAGVVVAIVGDAVMNRPQTTTDKDGRFVFQRVPAAQMLL